jgi:hypothetical protein
MDCSCEGVCGGSLIVAANCEKEERDELKTVVEYIIKSVMWHAAVTLLRFPHGIQGLDLTDHFFVWREDIPRLDIRRFILFQ